MPGSGINILLVDDNPASLRLMEVMLEKSGCAIHSTSSGKEALEAVIRYDYALILMDVVMNGDSGLVTAEKIRAHGMKSSIPIIFITGSEKDMDLEFMGYGAGAVDFIYKPVNPKVLLSKVKIFADMYLREKKLRDMNRNLQDAMDALSLETDTRRRMEDDLRRVEEKCKDLCISNKDLECQLRQAQKMEAVGTLAAGIAHDFNNILAAIMGNVELVLFDVPEDSTFRNSLDKVLKASHRAKKLVSQILSFSRRNTFEKKPVYIQNIVKETIELLRASIPSSVEIRHDMCPAAKSVRADSTQIHQVIMNLCTNACHAMEGGMGKITVTLVPYNKEKGRTGFPVDLKPGEYLKLSVSDTGCGMSSHVMKRVFDPYFTTKSKGEGTGMGLAVVHGIVKAHDGAIEVTSEPGKGSTFSLYLPVVELEADMAAEFSGQIPKGTEHILLVDDEEALTDIGAKMLARLGYRVTAETSSVKAFKKFRQNPEGFDVVVTDMTMPDLTGIQLARKIREIDPGIPIIMCTGFHKDINMSIIKSFGVDHLVFKPLKIAELSGVIRQAVDSAKVEAMMSNG
jgi:signal transduction histidine kinase